MNAGTDADALVESATISIDDITREFIDQSKESALAYLRHSWLSTSTQLLRAMRRRAGLSQEDLAQRLGTTQSAIARYEKDTGGRMTLHRFIDYVIACDFLPFNFAYVSVDEMISYVHADPSAARTEVRFCEWVQAEKALHDLQPTGGTSLDFTPYVTVREVTGSEDKPVPHVPTLADTASHSGVEGTISEIVPAMSPSLLPRTASFQSTKMKPTSTFEIGAA